jgi:hypothetical protein
MSSVTVLMLGGVILLGGCATAAQRRAAENAATAQEVERICSLPPAERDAELKKLKEQSGMALFCGRSEATEPED